METPRLIESGVRNYMHSVLHKCYDQRIHWYSLALNVAVLVFFVVVIGGFLWYCASKKLSPEEQRRKMIRDQQHVLAKIREFQIQKDHQKEQMSHLIRRAEPVASTALGQDDSAFPEKHVDRMYSMAMA